MRGVTTLSVIGGERHPRSQRRGSPSPGSGAAVIVATRKRAHDIGLCLDSIAAAFAEAGLTGEAEIVIVDNGLTDSTAEIINGWAGASGVLQHATPIDKPVSAS